MVWSEASISECPGCGKTVVVGIMSLCATCPYDGFYYVDSDHIIRRELRKAGWYSSRDAYMRGDARL